MDNYDQKTEAKHRLEMAYKRLTGWELYDHAQNPSLVSEALKGRKGKGLRALMEAASAEGWTSAGWMGVKHQLASIYPHSLPWDNKCVQPSGTLQRHWVCPCGRVLDLYRGASVGRNIDAHMATQHARRAKRHRKASAKKFKRLADSQ